MGLRDGWFDVSDEFYSEEEVDAATAEIDARMAAWITSVSPPVAGSYLYSGLSLPEPPNQKPGVGEDWQERAVASVLSECYARKMLDPNRERIDEVAISAMPLPTCALDRDEDAEDVPPFLAARSPMRMWERAVSETSEKVAGFLRYGPTARLTVGEALAGGEDMMAKVRGLLLRQRVDLLWKYADGDFVAVIVVGEPDFGRPPCDPSEDWRAILAAEIVHANFGRIPEVHLARVNSGVSQAVRPSRRHLTNSVYRLVRAANEAWESRDAKEGSQSGEILQNGYTYPVTYDAIFPLQRGDWPGQRRAYSGRPRRPA